MKRLLAVGLISIPFSAQCYAQNILSAACAEPQGVRYDLEGGRVTRNDDGFSGVNPQFVFSNESPSKITVIWPDARALGDRAKQNAHEATVIDINDEMLSAIVLYDNRVNLHTLFPKKGIAFMSTHKSIPVGGGVPSGSIFKLMCKFEAG